MPRNNQNRVKTTTLTVNLLLEEDLHTGSRTGTMAIDSLQARDERGWPWILPSEPSNTSPPVQDLEACSDSEALPNPVNLKH